MLALLGHIAEGEGDVLGCEVAEDPRIARKKFCMHNFRPRKGSRSFFVLRAQENGFFSHYLYLGTCKFNPDTGLSMPGCSYVAG